MLRFLITALVVVAAPLAASGAPAPGPEPGARAAKQPPMAGVSMGQPADPKADPMGGMSGMKGWKPYDYSKKRPESIPSGTLVIIAYILIWAVVLAYVVILARRQSKLREELAELRRRLESAEDGSDGGERSSQG